MAVTLVVWSSCAYGSRFLFWFTALTGTACLPTYLPTHLCYPVRRFQIRFRSRASLRYRPVLHHRTLRTQLTIRQTPTHPRTHALTYSILHSGLRAQGSEKKKEAMCIKVLVQYACGHAEVEFMNLHCECALIVGPVVERRGRCRRVCGGGGKGGRRDAMEESVERVERREGVR